MKFWTIQSKDVIRELNSKGIYYPDMEKSKNNLPMRPSYKELLANYNVLNKKDARGLIFGFHSLNAGGEIEGPGEIYDYLRLRPELKSLFSSGKNEDYCILELGITEPVNLLPIDFNDYIKLTLWANYQRNYNEELLTVFENEFEARKEILKIKKYLPKGREVSGPGSFIQVHYSQLAKEDILSVHHMIDFNTGEDLALFDEAKN